MRSSYASASAGARRDREGITTYDASHLWLARTLDLDLVTLDGELARAAAKERREEHGPAERS